MSGSTSLLPREHGAYAELGFPLVTGLLLGRPGVAAVTFAVAAVAWFLVHEPVAVLAGRRGVRIKREVGQRARARLIWLTAIGATASVAALAWSPPPGRLAAIVPAGLAAVLLPVVIAGRQKTLWAESLVVAVFATALLPVAMAGGANWSVSRAAAGVWFVSFLLGTVMVHKIKADHKRPGTAGALAFLTPLLAMGALGGSVAAARGDVLSHGVAIALLPAVIVTLAVSALRVHPRRLRTVGWTIVGANVVTLLLLVLAVGR